MQQDRDKLWALVNPVRNLLALFKVGWELFDQLSECWLNKASAACGLVNKTT
jgi:hypothetical protein